jgi:hypothetical protein
VEIERILREARDKTPVGARAARQNVRYQLLRVDARRRYRTFCRRISRFRSWRPRRQAKCALSIVAGRCSTSLSYILPQDFTFPQLAPAPPGKMCVINCCESMLDVVIVHFAAGFRVSAVGARAARQNVRYQKWTRQPSSAAPPRAAPQQRQRGRDLRLDPSESVPEAMT